MVSHHPSHVLKWQTMNWEEIHCLKVETQMGGKLIFVYILINSCILNF